VTDFNAELTSAFQDAERQRLDEIVYFAEDIMQGLVSPRAHAHIVGMIEADQQQLAEDPEAYFDRQARINAIRNKYIRGE
jgi:ethanolamine utilization cobalamin adenosyltransferase